MKPAGTLTWSAIDTATPVKAEKAPLARPVLTASAGSGIPAAASAPPVAVKMAADKRRRRKGSARQASILEAWSASGSKQLFDMMNAQNKWV
jgi:hypothetical protein